MAMRAPDPAAAATLSAMAQSVGYLLAAFGPLLFGLLHVVFGSWQPAILLLCGVTMIQGIAGFIAGRGVLSGSDGEAAADKGLPVGRGPLS